MKTDEIWYIFSIIAILIVVIVYAMSSPLGDDTDEEDNTDD